MSDVIEFVNDWFAEVEGSPGQLRQRAFRKGTTLQAEILPIKARTANGDSANLRFEDGTTALSIPLSCITVGGDQARAA